MPPKRTPPKAKTPKEKIPKGGKPRLVAPVIRSRDSSADSIHSVPAGIVNPVLPPVIPVPAGVSPDFMAYIQMQERIRQEEKVVMERQRKEDLECSELDRHAQQKAHEVQIQMLQDQLRAMSTRTESNGPKSSSKMPSFDLVKYKETF